MAAEPDLPDFPGEADPPEAMLRAFLARLTVPRPLLVAFSGGGDSTALLLLVARLRAASALSGIPVFAATVDHGLRPESRREAAAAAAVATDFGIPHHILCWQGEKPATGLQAAAREARYRLLGDHALALGNAHVLTAHTADDQRETLAMRLARNPETARGMAEATLFDRRIWFLRPLLGARRDSLRRLLLAAGQSWSEDPSNVDRRFERVRVRQDLPPASGPEDGARAAQAADQAVATALARFRVSASAVAALEPADADSLSMPGMTRALLLLAAVLGGRDFAVGRQTAARIATFLHAGTLGRMTASRTVFDRRRSGLYLYREARDLPALVLPAGAGAIHDGRLRLTNHSDAVFTIAAGARRAGPDRHLAGFALPAGVAARAARAMPALAAGVEAEPVLAGFDHLLPAFDKPVADALALLFGRPAYPALPLGGI